jgi:hypothetical protein
VPSFDHHLLREGTRCTRMVDLPMRAGVDDPSSELGAPAQPVAVHRDKPLAMLREDVDRLSDVELAVEVLPKIADRERLAAENRRRVEAQLAAGHVFRNILDIHFYWYREVFDFEESQPRVKPSKRQRDCPF